MKKLITYPRRLFRQARKPSSGLRRSNFNTPALVCALSMLLFGAIGAAQAQQPDPLTITKEGNVGIGTTLPANKLSVAGNADFTGNVGVGTTAPANKLSVAGNADFTGNVGVGTSTPANKLSVAGNADFSGNVGIGINNPVDASLQIVQSATNAARKDLFQVQHASNNTFLLSAFGQSHPKSPATIQLAAWNSEQNIAIVTDDRQNLLDGGSTKGIFIKSGGNVGIGTTNPTKGKLQVVGSTSASFGQVTVLRNNDSATFRVPSNTFPVSIYADNAIAAFAFWAFSDARLKHIEGRSLGSRDLTTLMEIEVTDYSYVDSRTSGTGNHKKVIGQQVEKVFPQAVTRSTDVVPDIYQRAAIKDGWVMLATNLKKGERVRLIGEKQEGIHEVLEVAEGRFRTAFTAQDGPIFVYGREVNDARSVDYEAISMLNVSATQQIKKEKDEEVKALQEENAALRSQLAEQEKRLGELEASVKTRDEKLAAIETLLLSGDKPAVRTASMKKVD